ncbi:phospholipase A-2-activating protein [Parasteatoda tepidariorum]|uniref:phospholipase A-2-activating protein n=1 Tax=Parasteatoda tepidariorum TaxID=114398 RepID=UPI00077F9027|nr:phospholipase A-2-activating protein [Parasteatoda tepidariorum]
MDTSEMQQYKYSIKYAYKAHDCDVRVVKAAAFSDSGIITGSRDSLVKVWTSDGENSFKKECTLVGATNFIASLCILPSSSDYPDGLILAGSNDSKIYGFTFNSSEPVLRLFGHSSTVCSLSAGNFGFFVSGSWDKTARLWTGQQCTNILEGHDQAVWATEVLPCQNIVLTGSADRTIRIWHSGTCQKVLYGHEDCVRGLAIMSNMNFLSCSNDGSIRMWNLNGECLNIYNGSSNYIYSITIFNNGVDFATCGEDQILKIWEKGHCVQAIAITSKTLWSVTCLTNGDLAVGCSDGSVYIIGKTPLDYTEFTYVEEKRSDSPLPTVDGKPGDEIPAELFNKDPPLDNGGDCNNDNIEFLIEVKGQFFKVIYRKGEDPWDVAQKFVAEHSLAISHTSEIADYIFKLTASELNTVQNDYFPVKEYFLYTNINANGLKAKLLEFSSVVPKEQFVQSSDIENLALLTKLPDDVSKEQLQSLDVILTWSDEYLFPALDLLRLAVRCKVIRLKVVSGQTFINHLLQIIRSTNKSVNKLLVIKIFCNLFDSEEGEEVVMNFQDKICTTVKEVLLSNDKNIQKACASLLMNYAIAGYNGRPLNVEHYCRDVSEVLYILVDSEALYRALVGIGTLSVSNKIALSSFKTLNVQQFLLKCKEDVDLPANVTNAAKLLIDVLKS